jgi:hypothetical protein
MDSKPCYLARLNQPISGLVGPQAETYLALLQ